MRECDVVQARCEICGRRKWPTQGLKRCYGPKETWADIVWLGKNYHYVCIETCISEEGECATCASLTEMQG